MLRRPSRPLPAPHAGTAPAPRSARSGLLRPGRTAPGPGVETPRPATTLEACIEHHLARVRVDAGARPGVIDDATARVDPPTRPFSMVATAPEPRRAPSGSAPRRRRPSVRTSPRGTAVLPAVVG